MRWSFKRFFFTAILVWMLFCSWYVMFRAEKCVAKEAPSEVCAWISLR